MMLTIRRNTCIANFTDPELGLRCFLTPYSFWSPPDCHRVGGRLSPPPRKSLNGVRRE